MKPQRHIDRRALFASGAAAALLAATGVSARPGPERGGRMRMALSGATRADTLDFRAPANPGLYMQVAGIGTVFDALTEVAADGTLRGELATSWISNDSGTHWAFELRDDVRFHNGSAFTAADAAETLSLHRNGALSDAVLVAAHGRTRLDIALSAPDPDLPLRLSAPQFVILPLGRDSTFEPGIGTGLYSVQTFRPGRQFIAGRVAQHYKDGRAGWFDSIELVSLTSDAVRAEALRDHLVDVADLSHAADLGDLSRISILPEETFMTAAVDDCIALPGQVGRRWPLDNLRAAERWWMA